MRSGKGGVRCGAARARFAALKWSGVRWCGLTAGGMRGGGAFVRMHHNLLAGGDVYNRWRRASVEWEGGAGGEGA